MIYTAFLVFTLAGYGVIGLMVLDRTGVSERAYVNYYRGNEAADRYAKTDAEMLETTHFHLFSYPVFLLIQGHIFLLTSWPRKLKAGVVVAAFAGAGCYLVAPWLVMKVSPGLVWTETAGRVLLLPCLFLFLVVPLYEMWWFPRRVR